MTCLLRKAGTSALKKLGELEWSSLASTVELNRHNSRLPEHVTFLPLSPLKQDVDDYETYRYHRHQQQAEP